MSNREREELSVSPKRVYFADYTKTDFGYFESRESMLTYANENADEVTGCTGTNVIRFEWDWNDGVHLIWQYDSCFYDRCDCSASAEDTRRRQANETGLSNDEYDSFPRNPKDCEQDYLIDEESVQVGVLV